MKRSAVKAMKAKQKFIVNGKGGGQASGYGGGHFPSYEHETTIHAINKSEARKKFELISPRRSYSKIVVRSG